MVPYVLIGILALGMLAIVALALRIASWRLALPEFEPLTRETIPPEHFEALRPLAEKLAAKDLIFCGMQREVRGNGEQWWQAVFRSPDGGVWAVVERTGTKEARLVLHSFFPEGRAVTTSSGEFADYDVVDDWRLTEQRWEDFDTQVTFHRQKTLGNGKDILQLQSIEQFNASWFNVAKKQFHALYEKGFLVSIPDRPSSFKGFGSPPANSTKVGTTSI